ncbi:MAG: ThuA domain-containing protein, partial [Victivallales bacterium]|nr:ThuA domain-containing protein [Victivallales bacterium]
MIRVTIWNENVHETDQNEVGEICRKWYPEGIHTALKNNLAAPDLEIRTAFLAQPAQGLPDELLRSTDVLLWWGHCAHGEVEDALVSRIQDRVLGGMGLIVLHSGHKSKIFQRMLGTSCSLVWRDIAERERVWTIDPSHPIAQGVPASFPLEHTEMYGEPFGIPDDGKIVFLSWYQGGNVFRSGVCFQRDRGKIFYFAPGHETFPIYHNTNVVKILANAIRWAAPIAPIQDDAQACPHEEQPIEPVI